MIARVFDASLALATTATSAVSSPVTAARSNGACFDGSDELPRLTDVMATLAVVPAVPKANRNGNFDRTRTVPRQPQLDRIA